MDNYDYKGWKILNKLHIFAKKYPSKYREYAYPQAMIASSEKPEALETAKNGLLANILIGRKMIMFNTILIMKILNLNY